MDLAQITDARSPAYTPGIPRPPNLPALTSIRFFAALHVALYHMVRPFSLWGPFTSTMSAGYVGVSFFFVLSGYILTYSHAQEYESGKGRPAKFWMARFARVYPIYLFVLLLAGYFGRAAFENKVHILAFIADIFMVQSWSVRMAPYFNNPGWSLSSEAFFYLLFPFLLLPLRPSSATRALLAALAFWLLALAAPLLVFYLFPAESWHEGVRSINAYKIYRVRRMPLLALPEFLTGISLGWFHLRYGIGSRLASILAIAGILALGAALAFSDHLPFVLLHNGLLIPIFAMLLLGFSRPHWLTRALSHPALMLLGEASFALYITHFLFNDWTKSVFGAGETILDAAWKLAVIVPISVLLHLFVERPFRRILLSWWRNRHATELKMTTT